ncbi:MAG: nuclear transport factor 2 family protein [Parafilimonas sp.]
MTTKEVADRLVELCRKGNFETIQSELFADDAVSIEQHATPAFEKETKGKKAIKEKGDKWNAMVAEVHDMEVSDPVVATDSFAITMRMHVTMKEHGKVDMTELCVYSVKDGKIVSEQFFVQKN